MAVNTIPKREEIPEEYTWNLADMYADDAAWSAEYEALKALPDRIAAYAGRLGEGAQTLLEFFRLEDEADVRLGMLLGYASCKSDQDTGNAVYLDMRGKAVGIYVAASSAAARMASPNWASTTDSISTSIPLSPGSISTNTSLDSSVPATARFTIPLMSVLTFLSAARMRACNYYTALRRNSQLGFVANDDKLCYNALEMKA